jgi:hypothetical protein
MVEVSCAIPAAVPFLFMGQRPAVLRVSNAVFLVLLFAAGYGRGGQVMESKRIFTGLAAFLLGLAFELCRPPARTRAASASGHLGGSGASPRSPPTLASP